jgi:hypothetical protein
VDLVWHRTAAVTAAAVVIIDGVCLNRLEPRDS